MGKYYLDEEQVKRIKRLLTAFESGELLKNEDAGKKHGSPVETRIVRSKEIIDGVVVDNGEDETTYMPGEGEVALYKLNVSSNLMEDTGLTETVYNLTESIINANVFLQVLREPISGKLFVIAQKDAQKAKMIDDLVEGQTGDSEAWLLTFDLDSEQWEQSDNKINVYGDQGFRGVAFKDDVIDVVFSNAAGRWYGVVGSFFFHANCLEDIDEGGSGQVQLFVGAGDDKRSIAVEAYSPFKSVLEDFYCPVVWNSFSKHWDIIAAADSFELGCGVEYFERDPVLCNELDNNGLIPQPPILKVNADDLAGCGLIANPANGEEGCQIQFNAAAVAGNGLQSEGCQLKVNLTAGCGVSITGGSTIAVNGATLAGNGLTNDGCELNIVGECGILVDENSVSVNAEELAGSGLEAAAEGGGCVLNVKVACGLALVAEGVRVDNTDLAGDGLTAGTGCQLDVDCEWIRVNCCTEMEVVTDVSCVDGEIVVTKETVWVFVEEE